MMYLNELIIEVTRRCNLACRHCLRGDPQNKDIDNATIDRILEDVSSIGVITFTGGEPTLAVDRIRYITDQIIKRDINLDGFYLVTNGVIASRDLVHTLVDLYAHIKYKEESNTSLCISQDQYHQEEVDDISEAEDLYSALTFFHKDSLKQIRMLINEGRTYEGKADEKGEREAYLNDLIFQLDDDNNLECIEGSVYINVLGEVITSCDMSYQSQQENKIGNVNDRPLSEILTTHFNKVEVLNVLH